MLMRFARLTWCLFIVGGLNGCGGGGGGGQQSLSDSAPGNSSQPASPPPTGAAPAPPPPSGRPPAPLDASQVWFSRQIDLSHGAPVAGSRQKAGLMHAFVRTDSVWGNKTISQVLFRCCDPTSAPLRLDSPDALRAVAEPWSTVVDLSGARSGSLGHLEARAFFEDGSASEVVVSQFTIAHPNDSNTRPRIVNGGPGSAVAGRNYWYRPDASDADGDPLGFSARNLPDWLSFDSATGTLDGRPTWTDVGAYSGIVVVAADGQSSSLTEPFTINVAASASGRVTLSWRPPTERENGQPLNNLAGYRLLFGQRSRQYDENVYIDSPGITSYTVDNLLAGDWFFVMTAVDRDGLESGYSAEIRKTIR